MQINHRFRVQFETDAVNDYFTRETFPGKNILSTNGVEPDHIMNLWNAWLQ
jgi:hypothetical protein